jgi:serine protease Do
LYKFSDIMMKSAFLAPIYRRLKGATQMKSTTIHKYSVGMLIISSVFFGFVLSSFFQFTGSTQAENQIIYGIAGPHWVEASEQMPELSFKEIGQMWSDVVVNIEAQSADKSLLNEGNLSFDGNVPKSGTGVIIDPQGHVLTNWHVIEDSNKIVVRLIDDSLYNATIIGADKETDLALLRIDSNRTFRAAILGDSDSVSPGEWVMAIGNPSVLRHTITVGVVSAIGRNFLGNSALSNYIQTDAAINPGNSGGPLMNTRGEVIGINTLILEERQNLGFAIPINLAKLVITQLKENGKVDRGYMGLTPGPVSEEIAQVMNLPSAEGAIVETVQTQIGNSGQQTPAARAGFKVGDVITRFDNRKISSVEQIYMFAAYSPPGKEISVEIYRNGKPQTLQLKLAERPSYRTPLTIPLPVKASGQYPLGLNTEPAETALLSNISLSNGIELERGLRIKQVEVASSAFNYGIRAGAIIASVNGVAVGTPEEFSTAVQTARAQGLPVVIYVAGQQGLPGLGRAGAFISFPAE